jgi:hypothetical protein
VGRTSNASVIIPNHTLVIVLVGSMGRVAHPTASHFQNPKGAPSKLRLGGPAGPRLLALTLAFRNDSELDAQGVQNGIDGFEPWVCACTQGFVQALPA